MNTVKILWQLLVCRFKIIIKIRHIRRLNRRCLERGIWETSSPRFQFEVSMLFELKEEIACIDLVIIRLEDELSLSLSRKNTPRLKNKRE